jgi:hypothetical protein
MTNERDGDSVLNHMIRGLTRAIRFIHFSTRRYFIIALVVFISITSLGVYNTFFRDVCYEAEMVCVYNSMDPKTYGELIYDLEALIETKSYKTLASMLHLSVDEAKSIISINANNYYGTPLIQDYSKDQSQLHFKVRTSDPASFKPLQDGLINYLNSSSAYTRDRNEIEADISNRKIAYINRDITLIDSVVFAYKESLKKGRPSDSSNFLNIMDLLIYKDKLEDKELFSTLLTPHKLKYIVELHHGFVPTEHPLKPDIENFILYILAAFMLSCVVCTILAILKKIL